MHMPGQVPTWLLAVIAAAAGVMVGSFLAVQADRTRADRTRADRTRADRTRADRTRAGQARGGRARAGWARADRTRAGQARGGRARAGWAPGGQGLAVELGTGACFAVMALRFGPSPVLPAFLLLAALAPVLTLTDLR